MRLKVGADGLLIPKELLSGMEEVEVHRSPHTLTVTLVADQIPARSLTLEELEESKNQLLQLGTTILVDDGPEDAAQNHDRYIYGDLL